MGDTPSFGRPRPGFPIVHRPTAYALIREDAGRIAVVRTPKALHLPGGGIEAGETPEQAVAREVQEEAGLRIGTPALILRAIQYVFSRRRQVSLEKDCYFFSAPVVGHAPASEPDHELVWMKPQDAALLLKHSGQRWVTARYGSVPSVHNDK